jgi:hypothetical protein
MIHLSTAANGLRLTLAGEGVAVQNARDELKKALIAKEMVGTPNSRGDCDPCDI